MAGFRRSAVLEFMAGRFPERLSLADRLEQAGIRATGRALRVLEKMGIDTPKQLAALDLARVSSMPNVGRATLAQLREAQKWAISKEG